MIIRIAALLCLLSTTVFAQVTDDFSDGDFTSNPTWAGDDAQFTVLSNQLKLNSTGTDTSYLATSSIALLGGEWQIWTKLSFNPSSGNYARIYLASNQSNLYGSLNGYYVQLGGVGTVDDIRLFRQDGTTAVQLIDGPDSTLSGSTNTVSFKITCDANGLWTVYADTLGGQNFEVQGTVTDNTYNTATHFGVWCKYTSSNATKFYFDDVYAGPIIVDNTAPSLISAKAISANKVDLLFDESVTSATAQSISNYIANNGLNNPATASLDLANPALVHLTFTNNFTSGTTYQITATNIQDLTGNTLINGNASFTFYDVRQYDVMINEIFPDPSPSVGLPTEEFIEIYNRTAYPIAIQNWTLKAGSNLDILPDATIQPDSFLLLVSTSAYPYYIDVPNAIEVTGLSYQALTNDGQTLTLRDTAGNLIHTITYTSDWYQDSDKKDGGYSIEQIDPLNPCGGLANWKASNAFLGGTPGKRNSLNATNADIASPEPLRVNLLTLSSLSVVFDEALDSASATSLLSYSVDNGIGSPISDSVSFPSFSQVTLNFQQTFQAGIIYTLSVQGQIRDCVGNLISQTYTLRFAVPQAPAANDVVINELLSDPKTGGEDYVELYNRSNKVIDLKDLKIARYDEEGMPETWYTILPQGYLLFPADYVVLTENSDAVKEQYNTTNPKGIVTIENLPDFNIDGGSCIIGDSASNIIDAFTYDSKMQFPLLQSTKGVALERLNPDRASYDRDNWHSAAETVGYGTPAYQNSQYNENSSATDFLVIEPPIFSPDNDGYQDLLNITLNMTTPENVASLDIYDAKGQLVTKLAQNKLLGISNTFTWDGITERGDKARIGIYILYADVFDRDGNKKKAKKTFVLGDKL